MVNDAIATDTLLSPEEIRLLSALGFMAARAGHVVPAIRIFEGLATLRKDKAFPYVGLALAMICVGAYGDAARVLGGRGMAACPGDPEIEAYLGLALQLSGHASEAEALSRRLRTRPDVSESLRALSQAVAGLADGRTDAQAWPMPASLPAERLADASG